MTEPRVNDERAEEVRRCVEHREAPDYQDLLWLLLDRVDAAKQREADRARIADITDDRDGWQRSQESVLDTLGALSVKLDAAKARLATAEGLLRVVAPHITKRSGLCYTLGREIEDYFAAKQAAGEEGET